MNIAALNSAQHEQALIRARKRVKEIRSFYLSVSLYCVIIPCLWLINYLTLGNSKAWWAHWPTLGWGIGLTIQAMTTFAGRSFFGSEWEARKVDELMARENLKIVSSEKQLMQAQMRMLQAQIEPHFLFNTLANVQSLISRSPERATLMLDNFISYLRQTLSASRSQEGTVKQEMDLLRNYLDLIKIRMGERLQFSVDVDDTILSAPLPPMLLQPVVENAVKHGLEPKVEGGRVHIRATANDDVMRFEIVDNGLGFADGAHRSGDGIGLANLRERLAVLYDNNASLTVSDANPGTRIVITVPKITSKLSAP
jgi:sensor histidine kinase YesM